MIVSFNTQVASYVSSLGKFDRSTHHRGPTSAHLTQVQ